LEADNLLLHGLNYSMKKDLASSLFLVTVILIASRETNGTPKASNNEQHEVNVFVYKINVIVLQYIYDSLDIHLVKKD